MGQNKTSCLTVAPLCIKTDVDRMLHPCNQSRKQRVCVFFKLEMVLLTPSGHSCHSRTVLMMPNAYCSDKSKGWFHKCWETPQSLQMYLCYPRMYRNKDETYKVGWDCLIIWRSNILFFLLLLFFLYNVCNLRWCHQRGNAFLFICR